ncbi:sulfite reductase flavoprotein subunit alpha [Roseococcus sp. SYP-B2431]|uniref:sulfite reductase subunit alpha n=1 Tax=Roseococcus sp. SYP-B2431 TaxID=2496640 RepID=UPI0013F4639B|nr:sulfite reductase flavoprotein subunit alpha [Roseococcus sp. SYP-B2431]
MSPEIERYLTAGAVLLAYAGFCGFVAWRRRRRRAPGLAAIAGRQEPVLVAYASQTGFAGEIARRSAEALQEGGVPARLAPLETLDADTLAVAGRAVFVVSTTGEGDAPDHAARFVRRVMGRKAALSGLDYGLLALGDSSYARYCAFGRQLDAWLQIQGATPLFDRVEVDDADGGALRHWQYHLGKIAGTSETPDWAPARFAEWRLVERRLLNPGSPGGPAFHLALEPPEGAAQWQAGDIAEIGPRNARAALDRFPPYFLEALRDRILPDDPSELEGLSPEQARERQKPLPHREYSIASLASEGRLELVVRQARHPDGRLGLGSGWLTEHAPMGSPIALRVRSNRSFHAPEEDRPMILVGNGTGIAGLRAHLKAREAAGRRRNWLVFGERSRERDFLYREEIEGWVAAGVLARLDLAFSRDQAARLYVQDRLRDAADGLREWVDDGAAIYVCGSLEGMSAGVHAALTEALAHETLERLAEEGLYRRDVY